MPPGPVAGFMMQSNAPTGPFYQLVKGIQVTAVAPPTGPTAGGTLVTITGVGFTGATAVDFGPLAATSFTVISNTDIIAYDPAQPVGPVNVTVTSPLGTSAITPADVFTYTGGPTVTNVNPNSRAPEQGGARSQ